MSLNEEEKARIIALGMRTAQPESGFEKHFLRAIDDTARPCSSTEERWVTYFEQWYCDRVNNRVRDALDETADEAMICVSTWGDPVRPAHKGHRRRSARKSGPKIVSSGASAATSRGTPPRRRSRRGVPGSRRAK